MKSLKHDFNILNQKRSGHSLIYFDNAATTQKPDQVIDAISNFYRTQNAPLNRGVYYLSEHLTQNYEHVRSKIASFINTSSRNIAFTYGTTDSINILANSLNLNYFNPGDNIILSVLEHHSNLLAWQNIAKQKNIKLKFVNITPDGLLDMQQFYSLLDSKTKLVSLTYISNVLGTRLDIKAISDACKNIQTKLLVDAAQAPAHIKIDIKDIDPDFLVFSSHKMFGPDGLGVLYVKEDSQNLIVPTRLGGGIVYEADFEHSTFLKFPRVLEAGSQPVSAVIGLGAAIDYINKNINFDQLKTHEAALCAKLIDNLQNIPGINILGPIKQLKQEGHLVSFTINKIHAHDVASYLDKFNICVRAGHHCAQPFHKLLNISGSIRVSFAAYNTIEEVEFFCERLADIHKAF